MSVKPGKALKLPVQQLVILSICRFAEPVALTSVFPYLPEMIESFHVPANDVAQWVGITSAVFSFSQCLTGIAWGRASDYFGRKRTILLGLTSTMTACLFFGFSRSLPWAIVARSLAGASSGTVGIIRTTVAEMVPERELQPKAFSIMPLVWSIGSIAGPILGGALANPAANVPSIFGDIQFFKEFPFALPNLVTSVFFVIGISSGFLFLRETLETRKHNRDYGRSLGRSLVRCFTSRRWQASRRKEHEDDHERLLNSSKRRGPPPKPPGYRDVFTYQSNLNLFAYTLLALHSVAYDQLISVFLHSKLEEHRIYNSSFPLKFAGGFGLSTGRIGLILTIYGIVAMFSQFLVFPPVARKYGVLNCLRMVTFIYPFIYLATPFAVLLPTDATREIGIFCIMVCKCLASIFSFPCTTILLTNSAGSLRLLGTLNGVATSISAAGRGIGPFTVGNLFTWGMKIGYIVIPWWTLALFAVIGHIPTWWIVETDGFGSRDEDEESSDEGEGDSDEGETEIPLSPTHSRTTSGNNIAEDFETSQLSRQNSAFAPIVEEIESDDEQAADPNRPLLASSSAYPEARKASNTLLRMHSNSSRRSSSRQRGEVAVSDDFEEDESSTPIGMGQVIRKGRRLSSNLGLSEGLGRTDGGSGFGTRGPDLGMGYDRSRSVSKRRGDSRSNTRRKSSEIRRVSSNTASEEQANT